MDQHALEYYSCYSEGSSLGHFHHVIPLHDDPLMDWSDASKKAPSLCRGWYELAQLSLEDRIEFTKEFWSVKMPFHENWNSFLDVFFGMVDDVGVFLTQQKYDDRYQAHLVYSISGNSGFFHGEAPGSEHDIEELRKAFSQYTLPPDYLAFLQIHNGFAKLNDTGISSSRDLPANYLDFQKFVSRDYPITNAKGDQVDPRTLIPFYKSFGMPFFQCFWGGWYPDQEMGNVYYSDLTKTISNCTGRDDCLETMSFETFTEWLMFYLEKID